MVGSPNYRMPLLGVICVRRPASRICVGAAESAHELLIIETFRFSKTHELQRSHHAGNPIGSGAVERGNRLLVTQRLKGSGQRRGYDGGPGRPDIPGYAEFRSHRPGMVHAFQELAGI